MVTQSLSVPLDSHAPDSAVPLTGNRPAHGRSFLLRLLAATMESQRRRAEREIQHYLNRTGQRLPDGDTSQDPGLGARRGAGP